MASIRLNLSHLQYVKYIKQFILKGEKRLYGCGLRLSECLNLRVHNFNFDACVLTVHGKGGKVRTPIAFALRDMGVLTLLFK